MAMPSSSSSSPLLVPIIFLLALCSLSSLNLVRSDFASDSAECKDQLVGLAPCLTYIDGSSDAKAPFPDCCASLKDVVAKSLKCLCVLIKDRNQPELGLHINLNRTFALPPACHAPVNVSNCIRLLKLPANSTDAAVFRQFENSIEENSSSLHVNENSTSISQNTAHEKSSGGRMKLLPELENASRMWIWLSIIVLPHFI